MPHPSIVSPEEWKRALDALRVKEKAATRARDALAAERRRLPMVRIERSYTFDGPNGARKTLLDCFDGRRQLLLYHFMFGPNQTQGCKGCAMVLDQLCHPAHLYARDTSFVAVSRAPIAKIEAFRARMGWTRPWLSSFGTSFSHDFGLGPKEPEPGRYQDGEDFALSVFLRDGDDVYRTYFTKARGVETLGPVWTLLDLTPLGRQETWEDSPPGYPQTPPYEWWRLHDEYGS